MLKHATLSKCVFKTKKQAGQHLFCFNVGNTSRAPTFDNILSCMDRSQQDFDHLDSSDPPDFYRGCGVGATKQFKPKKMFLTPLALARLESDTDELFLLSTWLSEIATVLDLILTQLIVLKRHRCMTLLVQCMIMINNVPYISVWQKCISYAIDYIYCPCIEHIYIAQNPKFNHQAICALHPVPFLYTTLWCRANSLSWHHSRTKCSAHCAKGPPILMSISDRTRKCT